MFERFTPQARAIVVTAQHAATGQRRQVGTDHLLDALLDDAALRDSAGLTAEQASRCRAELDAARRRGGLGARDAAALAEIGIDLTSVIASVEASLGDGALARTNRPGRGWSPPAKQALAQAVRQAAAREDHSLRPLHLLLGVLTTDDLAADALASHGVDLVRVHAALDALREPA